MLRFCCLGTLAAALLVSSVSAQAVPAGAKKAEPARLSGAPKIGDRLAAYTPKTTLNTTGTRKCETC